MKKIQLKNIRSLLDTGPVCLSPITLLLGENSSGKSTFLRTFPLIRQSISKRTDGPLLWAGDVDDYVDFGSFAETVTNGGAKEMTFSFSFQSQVFDDNELLMVGIPHNPFELQCKQPDEITYTMTVAQHEGHEYVAKLRIDLNQTSFTFLLQPGSEQGEVLVNETLVVSATEKLPMIFSAQIKENREFVFNDFFPMSARSIFGFDLPSIVELFFELHGHFVSVYRQRQKKATRKPDYFTQHSLTMATLLFRNIGMLLNKGIPWENIEPVLTSQIRENVTQDKSAIPNQHLQIMRKIHILNPAEREHVLTICRLIGLYAGFRTLEDYLNGYFRQVHYIAPVRATAERYYRLRNLAIDEVDAQGKNLPMFLNSLSSSRMRAFQQWTQDSFGFQVMVERNAGHLSIKVARQTDRGMNLSDTGFGYSQILPIITQLWDLSTSPEHQQHQQHQQTPLVIAIEQPELHLHPALQAKLAQAFAASIQLAKEHHYELQLLLETHSETIVNYFGRAIARGDFRREDISIVLFDKNVQTNDTAVRTTAYDQDGFLMDWPIGFFAPER